MKLTYSEKTEVTKNIFEIAAIGAAAIFFVYKILGGWLLVNVAVTVELDRQPDPINDKKDYIAVTLKIEKKNAGSVVLDSVRARFLDLKNKKEIGIISLEGVRKLEYTQKPDEWLSHRENLKQRLTPGTTTQLSGIIAVPRNIPILVDVSLVSRRDFSSSKNQIRATEISLPKAKTNKANSANVKNGEAD